MATTRYPQFCALARAAELLGERWTLLIVRELLLGPQRFTDLKARLDGVSSSILSERLSRLEETGLIRRSYLQPPAASAVYELTDDGRALEPVIFALIRWGARFLLPRRPGDRVEPDWLRLVLAAYAGKAATPARSFELRVAAGDRQAIVQVTGGPGGTRVAVDGPPAAVTLAADFETVLALMAGLIDPQDALNQDRIQAQGDLSALAEFPRLFETTAREEADPATP